jgi:signal transduction histidine kinase
MSARFDIEKDNARFFRLTRQVSTMLNVLVCIYLVASTSAVLMDNLSYMYDWRGITCIVLTVLALLIYSVPIRIRLKRDCSLPWYYAVGIWLSFYCILMLLTLINNSFVWDFYVVYAISFGLFEGVFLWFAVSCIALTMFAFQGLLSWPLSGGALTGLSSQILALSSLTGLNMLFQHLVRERFERDKLFQQLMQANNELEEAHRQLAQSVIQEQELAVLRERTRLAREMHDTIGHALVLISVKLEAAQRLRERDPERCDHELESTKQIARETMTALRASIADLRSPAVEYTHINHALNRSTRELAQRTGLHVTYTCEADSDQLPEALKETLWKVSQEAFTNIEKHAHASRVEVLISQKDERILLHIHDDGIGLPAALCQPQEDGSLVYSSPNGHYGLRGMLERVEAIGGHLRLHSGNEQGTTIDVELPLAQSEPLESACILNGLKEQTTN